MNEQPTTADEPITPLQRALALLVAEGVFTAQQSSAVYSCAEVGFDGQRCPDEIMAVMEPLMTAPSYQRAFPGFPTLEFTLPPGWEDASFSADKCPSFGLEGPTQGTYEFILWVDYEDRTLRHVTRDDPGVPRYQLEHVDGVGDRRFILETNDTAHLLQVLLLVTLRTEVYDWQDALSGERPELDKLCGMVDDALRLNV